MAKQTRPPKVAKDPGVSLTVQSHAADADINRIVSRHIGPGRVFRGVPQTPFAHRSPMFGDFTGMDFQAMTNAIADVEQQFRSLPARIRSRFRNDPYQVVRFVEDEKNFHEAVSLGLVVPPEGYKPPPKPSKERVVQEDLVEQVDEKEALRRASVDDLAAALAAARKRATGPQKPPEGGDAQ